MNLTSRFSALTFGIAVLFISLDCQAQNAKSGKSKSAATSRQTTFTTGLGLRGGFEGGITFKHFIKESAAIEVLLSRGWRYGGFRVTGLYEIQKPLPGIENLDWFFGGGVHIGFYDGTYYGYYGYYGTGYYDKHGNWHPTGYRDRYTTIGIDGILGLEYQFTEVPITLSLDIKPYFDFYGRGNHYGDGALSIRYVLK